MGLALVENLIRYSQPGDDSVYGSHLFSFYDWDYGGVGASGLITKDGTRRHAYYALRLADRALAGAKPTYQVTTDCPDLSAIATREQDGRVNLLVLNWGERASYIATADLSGLLTEGAGTIRSFSAAARDTVIGRTALRKGRSTFTVAPWSAVLVTYRGR